MTKEEVERRLVYLKTLPKGWLGSSYRRPNELVGEPIDSAVLDDVIPVADSLVAAGMPYPCVFPTEEGGVELEWDIRGWSVTLEFELDGSAYLHAWNPQLAPEALDCKYPERLRPTIEMADILYRVVHS